MNKVYIYVKAKYSFDCGWVKDYGRNMDGEIVDVMTTFLPEKAKPFESDDPKIEMIETWLKFNNRTASYWEVYNG